MSIHFSETQAIAKLRAIRTEFAEQIRTQYERLAKSCAVCETPGACCLDAHFVNVRITRLEARAIQKRLGDLPDELKQKVRTRTDEAIEQYGLDRGALFEKGIGCLVHNHAKPLPCIAHACYENKEDLPPDEMLDDRELEVNKLNQRTYGESWLAPIPVAISKSDAFRRSFANDDQQT